MEIVIATRNEGKLREIQGLLKGLNVKLLSLKDIPGAPIVAECGSDFQENALAKAQVIASFTNKLTIADDSGLEVVALDGEPGVYSARFAGEGATDDENNSELLRRLEGVPRSDRSATFRCVVAVASPQGGKEFIEGVCSGIIQFQKRGAHGFGYDPLFYVSEYGKTFAELPPDTKNRISHRARAMKKLEGIIKDFL